MENVYYVDIVCGECHVNPSTAFVFPPQKIKLFPCWKSQSFLVISNITKFPCDFLYSVWDPRSSCAVNGYIYIYNVVVNDVYIYNVAVKRFTAQDMS